MRREDCSDARAGFGRCAGASTVTGGSADCACAVVVLEGQFGEEHGCSDEKTRAALAGTISMAAYALTIQHRHALSIHFQVRHHIEVRACNSRREVKRTVGGT